MVHPATRLPSQFLNVTALPLQFSIVNPRTVTLSASLATISDSATGTLTSPDVKSAGGQKYSLAWSRSKYHSPGASNSASRFCTK